MALSQHWMLVCTCKQIDQDGSESALDVGLHL